MPAPSPTHAEPVTAAVAAAANAAPSILPSSPMSTTPERSEKSPPSAASTSGAAPRAVAASEERAEQQRVAHARTGAGSRRTSASSGRRSACSSAPQTRMMSPWITTTMSRVSFGMSNDSSDAALVERAEQDRGQHDAHRVVAAHQRHRDADVAGAAGKFRSSRCWTPITSFRLMSPASAPETDMATTIVRAGRMPP